MLVHPFLDLGPDIILDIHDLHLIDQLECQHLITFPEIRLVQDLLLVRIIQRNVGGDLIHQLLQIADLQDPSDPFLGHLPVFRGIVHENVFQAAYHGLSVQILRRLEIRLIQDLHLRPQVRCLIFYAFQDPPRLSCHQNPKDLLRQLDDLPDRSHRAHLIHLLLARIFRVLLSLQYKEDLLILHHGLLHRGDRPLPADVKMHHHLRHDRHPPQGNHREAFDFTLHVSLLLFVILFMADEICREYCASRNSVKIPFDAFIIIRFAVVFNMEKAGIWPNHNTRPLLYFKDLLCTLRCQK